MNVTLDGTVVSSDDELIRLYQERCQRLGFCARAVFYRNACQHEHKLEVIRSALERVVERDHSILDIGCGWGRLLDRYTPPGGYLGIDLVPEFVDEARRRHPSHTFWCHSAFRETPPANWVVLAGVLSSVPQSRGLLERALQLCQSGIVFDFSAPERLPANFSGLARWERGEVLKVMSDQRVAMERINDDGASWVVVTGRPLVQWR